MATIEANVPDYLAKLEADVAERVLDTCDHAWVALKHFDKAFERNYGSDFYSSLRYLITDQKRLTLLVQSRATFASCLPPNHALSYLEMETIELRSR